MEAKNAQKSKTEDALSSMEAETGARGMAKEESQTELDALTKQVEADKKFIENTIKDLANKKEEWKDRSELRTGELAAVSKAIEILYSDDARDLFKKSFSSQGLFFLQMDATTTRRIRAADVIRRTSSKSHDRRLTALAFRLAGRAGGHFDEVTKSIEEMVKNLKKEEASDKEIKETCEKDRMEDMRKAVMTSRTIDEHSDAIMKLEAEIEQINAEIKEKQEQIASIEKEVEEATKNRAEEKAEFVQSQKDDEAAGKLVKMAQGVLEDFYKESGLMLVQRRKMEPVVAGEAPPPPPATWDSPYGGKTGESSGIVAMLG
jgi:chromosome segregation ATPase